MSAAVASLIALLVAIVLSIVSRINVGIIAVALAWIVGVYVGGLKPEGVLAGFPAPLFITLAGVTLLFAIAEVNGTLERLATRALAFARGSAYVLPILFFAITGLVSSVGPGAISSVALVAPLAMAIGARAGVSPFLTALMVCNGANAGNLSPFSSVGVIANTKMAEAGLVGHEFKVWFANFIVHVVVSAAAYFWLRRKTEPIHLPPSTHPPSTHVGPTTTSGEALTPAQRITLLVIASWILGVLVFKLNLGLSAFTAAAILVLAGAVKDDVAIKQMPWRVIVMVCGVSILISILEKTGGMELFTAMIARLATPGTINGVIAFVTGTISTYSSTSGVVLPAFLPTVPGIVKELGGGDPLAIALSINVGSALVDVSPLSTSGALCLAALPPGADVDKVFRSLLIWGVSMTVVGALICLLLAGPLASF